MSFPPHAVISTTEGSVVEMTVVEMTFIHFFYKKCMMASLISFELIVSISCVQNNAFHVKFVIFFKTTMELQHVWK